MPVEPIEELEELKIQWYFNTAVKFEILKAMMYREGVFLSMAKKLTHRCLKINAIHFLDQNMERYDFFNPTLCFNVYNSLATYPDMPMFSWSQQKKMEEMALWNMKALSQIKSYDLAFDIDNKDFEIAYKTAARLKALLDKFQVAYSCKFSVTGETPVLIKIGESSELMTIKEAISLHKKGERFKTLSINSESMVDYANVIGFVEHKEQVYSVNFVGSNRAIRISEGHSLVFLDENLDIVSKPIEQSTSNDYLITPINYFNKENKKVVVSTSARFRKTTINSQVIVDEDLMKIAGYYLGDGCINLKHPRVTFTVGRHKKEAIKELKCLLESFVKKYPVPGQTASIIHYEPTKHNRSVSIIQCANPILNSFLHRQFGKLAHHKRLPSWIWGVGKSEVLALLDGYSKTDGHFSEYQLTIKSVSFGLLKSLCWLLKLSGIDCRLNYEKNKPHILPQGTFFKGSEVLIIQISREKIGFRNKSKFSPALRSSCLPTKRLYEVYLRTLPRRVQEHRQEYGALKKELASRGRIKKAIEWILEHHKHPLTIDDYYIINKYLNLIISDLGLTKIKKFIPQGVEEVYDFAVEGSECFFMGDYPILGRNSGSKGFHFVVPYSVLPDKLRAMPLQEMCDLFKHLAYELKTYWGMADIDMKIYDLRRIWKTPYSVVYPYYYVAMPLTDEQFDHFKLEDVWLPNLIAKAESMRDRGLLLRQRPVDNLLRFIEHVADKQQHKAALFAIFKSTKRYLIGTVRLW